MPTHEITTPQWQMFCDVFSKEHAGATATVQVISPDLGAQEEVHGLPFVGISFEAKGSEQGSITLSLGTEPNDHIEHRIERPTHLWSQIGEGAGDTLAIETADNTKTILQLQPVPALPE